VNVPKAVIDTSVFASGFLSKSTTSAPRKILHSWREGRFTLVMAPQLLEELDIVLTRLGVTRTDINALIEIIQLIGLHIPGAYETALLDKVDPKDNMFLASAFESKADFLVSTCKKHLLPIKHFHGTQIVNPAMFLRQLEQVEIQKKILEVRAVMEKRFTPTPRLY